jgi:aminoglycoside N3'-acetyltransferase
VVSLTLATVLESLSVPRGGILYVQSSTDWLAKAGFDAAQTLATLRDWVRPSGTLVMPSYPFRITHLEYLAARPRYDVRQTPSMVGLIPELFRRGDRVHRSADPDFAIAAEGPEAEAIVDTDLAEPDPFGRGSVYERLLVRSATLVGLGVSLNTNSFIHVIDSRYAGAYPRSPYGPLFDVEIVGRDGVPKTVQRRSLVPEFQQQTKPSAVAAAIGEGTPAFSMRSIDDALFFRWDLARWSAWCDAHASEASVSGRWPCWLSLLGPEAAA